MLLHQFPFERDDQRLLLLLLFFFVIVATAFFVLSWRSLSNRAAAGYYMETMFAKPFAMPKKKGNNHMEMELTLCERLEPEVQLYLATLQPASVTIEESRRQTSLSWP